MHPGVCSVVKICQKANAYKYTNNRNNVFLSGVFLFFFLSFGISSSIEIHVATLGLLSIPLPSSVLIWPKIKRINRHMHSYTLIRCTNTRHPFALSSCARADLIYATQSRKDAFFRFLSVALRAEFLVAKQLPYLYLLPPHIQLHTHLFVRPALSATT